MSVNVAQVKYMIAPRNTLLKSPRRRGSKERPLHSGRNASPPIAPELAGNGLGGPVIDAYQREALIREAAYLRAQQRGFTPGQALDDWLAAEQQVDRFLNSG